MKSRDLVSSFCAASTLVVFGLARTDSAFASQEKPPAVESPSQAAAVPSPAAPAPGSPVTASPQEKQVSVAEPIELAPGVWAGRTGASNAGWVDLGEGVALIDCGGSEAEGQILKEQIKKTTGGKPVKWVILTHLHGDVSSGLPAFFSKGLTVYVHEKVAPLVKRSLEGKVRGGGEIPVVTGVFDTVTIGGKDRQLEITGLSRPAHSSHDIYAFYPKERVLFSGDLLNPGICPKFTDPDCDPDGWLVALDVLQHENAKSLLGSDGSPRVFVDVEFEITREYMTRILGLLRKAKAAGYPEARISSELHLMKTGSYCPRQRDAFNALSLYRRMTPEGKFTRPATPSSAQPEMP